MWEKKSFSSIIHFLSINMLFGGITSSWSPKLEKTKYLLSFRPSSILGLHQVSYFKTYMGLTHSWIRALVRGSNFSASVSLLIFKDQVSSLSRHPFCSPEELLRFNSAVLGFGVLAYICHLIKQCHPIVSSTVLKYNFFGGKIRLPGQCQYP